MHMCRDSRIVCVILPHRTWLIICEKEGLLKVSGEELLQLEMCVKFCRPKICENNEGNLICDNWGV